VGVRKDSRDLESKRKLISAALLSLASFAASINLLFAAIVRIGQEFSVKPEILASISSIYFACFFAISLLAGYLSDRYGTRPILSAGSLFTLLGGLTFIFSSTPLSLVAGTIAMGIGGGVIESMSSALLARLFPDRERFAVNLSQAGYCLGAIAGPFLMGIFVPRGVGWRTFFLPVALLGLANFGLFTTSRFPAKPREKPINPQTAIGALRRWSVVQLGIVTFLYVLAETGVVGFLNIYLFEFSRAPEGISIQSISYFWSVMLVGRMLCGLLPGEPDERKLIFSTMTLGAVSIAFSFLSRDWRFSLACFLIAGFFMAGSWPTTIALTAARHRDHASTVVGASVAMGSLGCIVCPPIMGFLFQLTNPALVMGLPAIPLLLGGLFVLHIPPTVERGPSNAGSDNLAA